MVLILGHFVVLALGFVLVLSLEELDEGWWALL
jgi:hypothetical protein